MIHENIHYCLIDYWGCSLVSTDQDPICFPRQRGNIGISFRSKPEIFCENDTNKLNFVELSKPAGSCREKTKCISEYLLGKIYVFLHGDDTLVFSLHRESFIKKCNILNLRKLSYTLDEG